MITPSVGRFLNKEDVTRESPFSLHQTTAATTPAAVPAQVHTPPAFQGAAAPELIVAALALALAIPLALAVELATITLTSPKNASPLFPGLLTVIVQFSPAAAVTLFACTL